MAEKSGGPVIRAHDQPLTEEGARVRVNEANRRLLLKISELRQHVDFERLFSTLPRPTLRDALNFNEVLSKEIDADDLERVRIVGPQVDENSGQSAFTAHYFDLRESS